MKTRLITLLIPLLLLSIAIVPQAALAKPASFDCIAGNCTALSYWDGAGAGLHYFIYTWDVFHDNTFNYCANVPSGDVNSTVVLRVNTFTPSCNNGAYVTIVSANFGHSECLSFSTYGLTNQPHRLNLVEWMADHVSSHEVWGSQWTLNQYESPSTGAFIFQSRSVDHLDARNPPTFFWHTNLAPGNQGGNMYSCDYEPPDENCTPGK